jgi:aryl-phospho-beta-D-glucosidase BglC (GH1 family)
MMLDSFLRRLKKLAKGPRQPDGRKHRATLSVEALESRLVPTASPAVAFAVTSDWQSGYTANMTITDTLPTPVSNWQMSFDFDRAITQIWNASIVSHNGDKYVIANAGYNSTISPGSSVQFGFLGGPGNLGSDQPTDVVLSGAGQSTGSRPTIVNPATASTANVTGKSVNLSVLGADTAGASSLTYTWATSGSAPGSVSFSVNGNNAAGNTVATFAKAGTYTFQVTITDPAGLSATSNVQVTVEQTLTSVTVTPATTSIVVGGNQQFSAQADDQFGNALAVQPAFTWSVGNGGTVTATGLYAAPATAGTATAQAVTGGVSGHAAITITPAVTNSLSAAVLFADTADWGSGFTGNITITNQGTTPISGWPLQFNFPVTISNIWNAVVASHTGSQYSITNAGYNAAIAPGQSVTFGFNAAPGNITSGPTAYVLNGTAITGSSSGGSSGSGGGSGSTPTISISNPTVNEPGASALPDYFHTAGNQIVEVNGKPVQFNAVSWSGFETTTYVVDGLWARNWQAMMNQMVQLGFNAIRVPFSEDIFNAANVPNSINYNLNPDLQGLSSLQILDKIVAYAGQVGLRIILDEHSAMASDASNEQLWYISGSTVYTQQAWINDWVALAQRYYGNPTVIGADLHNEPHGIATWGDGNAATDWRMAAEACADAIQKVNPNWLIFVEGIQTYNGQSTWWGGNLMGAGTYPVALTVPNHVVYSPHDYPSTVASQPWFSASNYPNNLPGIWTQFWGYLYREDIAPVWLGEFGSKLQTTSDQQWFQQIVTYLGSTSGAPAGGLGMSWSFWEWNPNSADTGGILQDDWTTVNENKAQVLQTIETALPPAGGSTTVATFTVTLSAASTQTVTVNYATADGTAIAGTDYVAQTGTLTFSPGETQATILVPIVADPSASADLSFELLLSNPQDGVLAGTGAGKATIAV